MFDRSISRVLPVLALGFAASSAAATSVTSSNDQAGLSMTVYQQGFALVRDERTVDLAPGRIELNVLDISDQIMPESVFVVGQGLNISGIEYNRVSLTPANLLERHIGKPVRIVHNDPQPNSAAEEEGVLLAASDGVPIVQIGDRVEIGGPDAPWRLIFTEVPADLQGKNTLTLDIDNDTRGPQSLSLSYLSRGLSWQADYVGILGASNNLTVSGWVTVDNATSSPYHNARIQLLAGDLHQPDRFQPMMAVRAQEAAQSDLASSTVGDYHIYDLPEAVTLLPQQRRQVRLLAPRDVPVEREYRVEGDGLRNMADETSAPVLVRLHVRNDAPALGVPLPAGLVRVYGNDPQGMSQYLGEDRIGHTAKGEILKLRLGTAFDVRAKRTTSSFRRIAPQLVELEQQIRLINSKDEPVTIVVAERLPGDWEIQSSSHPQQKVSAQLVEWRIEVPAGSEQRLTYQARVQY